jgi:hypothetical protein
MALECAKMGAILTYLTFVWGVVTTQHPHMKLHVNPLAELNFK